MREICSWGSTVQDFRAFMLLPEATKLDSFIHSAALAVCHTVALWEAPKELKDTIIVQKPPRLFDPTSTSDLWVRTKTQRRVHHVIPDLRLAILLQLAPLMLDIVKFATRSQE